MDKARPVRAEAVIISRKKYGVVTELVLEAPFLSTAQPGQFVHVYCGGEGRILRRPYSLYDAGGRNATLLVRVVGSGSAWLEGREAGHSLDLLGPLGRGFSYSGGGANLLIAGGTGIVPLRFLYRRMQASGGEAVLLWGMERGEDYRGLTETLRREADLRLACEDGALGLRGRVLDLLDGLRVDEYEGVFACGPKGMLVDLAEKLGRKKPRTFQVSLEERMACGIGACRGCAVPAASPGGGYLMVCSDGPVFDGEELDWKRINH